MQKQDFLNQLLDTVPFWFDEGDPLKSHKDPKGKATPEWKKAKIEIDDGESYRYFCQPCHVDLDLLREIAESDEFELPSEVSNRLKHSES